MSSSHVLIASGPYYELCNVTILRFFLGMRNYWRGCQAIDIMDGYSLMTCDAIREYLRNNKLKTTGKKEVLLSRYAIDSLLPACSKAINDHC